MSEDLTPLVLQLEPGTVAQLVALRTLDATGLFDPNRDLAPATGDSADSSSDTGDSSDEADGSGGEIEGVTLSSKLTLVVLPFLQNFTPIFGSPGDTVHLIGQGFAQPGLQVTFMQNLSAVISNSSDRALDVVVPSGVQLGPLRVVTSLGSGSWVRPFVPATASIALKPDELATCLEAAATVGFGPALFGDRFTVLDFDKTALPSAQPACRTTLLDYTSGSALQAVVALDPVRFPGPLLPVGTIAARRVLSDVRPAIGYTEEADARFIAERGTLSTALIIHPGFEHLGLENGIGSGCDVDRCIGVQYCDRMGVDLGPVPAAEPPGGTFFFRQVGCFAEAVVDLRAERLVSLTIAE